MKAFFIRFRATNDSIDQAPKIGFKRQDAMIVWVENGIDIVCIEPCGAPGVFPRYFRITLKSVEHDAIIIVTLKYKLIEQLIA